jgi:hypothetical protein
MSNAMSDVGESPIDSATPPEETSKKPASSSTLGKNDAQVEGAELVPAGGENDAPYAKNIPEKAHGWPPKAPFSHGGTASREKLKEFTFWSDLTLQERITYRKEFLREYLSETKKCFPYMRKLVIMIYRISPWRAIVILMLNVINALLPALTLQTRGSFILIVNHQLLD